MDIFPIENNGTYEVTMRGRFTFADNAKFRDVIQSISSSNIRQILLRMEQVEFVDSAALGMLLLAKDEAEKQKKGIVVQGAHGQVKRMFDLAHFNQFFTLQ